MRRWSFFVYGVFCHLLFFVTFAYLVGFVGNPNRLDYTALGHTVVVSQRLQSIAAGGEVIISETVFRAVSGMFPVVPGEPVQVKGLSEPMTPYRVASFTPDSGA